MIPALTFLLVLPLFLPLGITLTVATVIEGLFLIAFLFHRLRASTFASPEVLIFLMVVSLNVVLSFAFHPEFSFQIVRSALGPVAFLLVAARLYRSASPSELWTPFQTRILLAAIVSVGLVTAYNPGDLISQNVSILLDGDPSSAERKFILPHTAFNILFPLFVLTGRWLPAAACLVVILAAGSRGALVAAVLTVTVFLLRERAKGLLPLAVVGLGIVAAGFFFPASFERLQAQSVFEDYTRIEEISAAARTFWDPAHVLTGLPFTFPYWEGYGAFTSFADEQERIFTNSMFDVHNGFLFVLLRFGIVGGACIGFALWRLWRDAKPLRPALVSYLLLWLTSAGPISAVDGAFALALAAMFVSNRAVAATPQENASSNHIQHPA